MSRIWTTDALSASEPATVWWCVWDPLSARDTAHLMGKKFPKVDRLSSVYDAAVVGEPAVRSHEAAGEVAGSHQPFIRTGGERIRLISKCETGSMQDYRRAKVVGGSLARMPTCSDALLHFL